MKLTTKQEKFCQLVAAGKGLSEAFRLAGYGPNAKPATINRGAKTLFDTPKISARIEVIQAKHAKRHAVTVDSLVDELEDARSLALRVESPSAAVSATMGKGKLLGLVVDKSDNQHVIGFENMSDSDLLAIVARVAGK